MEWTLASGEHERHNVTVITVGSRYYSLYLVSRSLSLATLSNPCNKVRGKILLKKSSGVFLHASLSLSRRELFYIYMCMYVDVNLHM